MAPRRQGKFRFEGFEVDLAQRTLQRAGRPIAISAKSFDLLMLLLENAPRTVTEHQLLSALWPNARLEESDLGQHIYLLRQALTSSQSSFQPSLQSGSRSGSQSSFQSGSRPGDKLILTTPGIGYRFTAEVVPVPEAMSEAARPPAIAAPAVSRTEVPALTSAIEEQPSPAPLLLSSPASATTLYSTEPVQEPVPESITATARETVPAPIPEQRREPSPASSPRQPDPAPEPDEETSSEDEKRRGFLASLWHLITQPSPWQVTGFTAVIALLAVGGWLGWRWMHRNPPTSLSLVIGDFQNNTGETQFDPALRTAIAIDLRQSPYLQIASRGSVVQTLAVMKLDPAAPLAADTVREVCHRLNDQAYLTGEIHHFAEKYLVTLEAFDCTKGHSLAASRGIADSPDAALRILDRVAADLRQQLGEPARSVADFSKPLFADRSGSLEALQAYSEASRLAQQNKLQEAVDRYQRAIALDPDFAIAMADLSAVYLNLGKPDFATATLSRAYELRDTVDERDRLFLISSFHRVVTGDLKASLRNDEEWGQKYSTDPAPLTHKADLENQMGRSALALEPAKRALELNPADTTTYEVLARAQMHLGQFEEAASTCRAAIAKHADSAEIHGYLLQIGFLRLDQPAIDEQTAWAKTAPPEMDADQFMLLQQGLIALAQGKIKTAQTVFNGVADLYRKQGKSDLANQTLSALPRIEAELGLTDAPRALLARLPEMPDSTDVAVAWAHLGETTHAQNLLQNALNDHPTATLWQDVRGPQIRAAIDLNLHEPEDAVQALQAAAAYDLASFQVPALRGRAYLAAKQPDLAEIEFRKILEHPGIEPLSHNYPLAQLGLARALAAQGKVVEASLAYDVLLQIWKDADSDLPRLKEAKAEYAKITGSQAKGSASGSGGSNGSNGSSRTGGSSHTAPKSHHK